MDIDLARIEANLIADLELIGKPFFKVRKHTGRRLSIRETDTLTDIRINPHKVRTQGQLDELVAQCQNTIMRG